MSAKRQELKMSPIKSSWLTGAHYNPQTKVCTVQMKSGAYCGEISQQDFDDFAKTFQVEDSSGKHFNAHLRKAITKKL